MRKPQPTILCYGTIPSELYSFLLTLRKKGEIGLVVDDGGRDPIFTFYENLARADAILVSPTAHPAHIISLLTESEVGHPLILQGRVQKEEKGKEFPVKPVIFYGPEEEWRPFQEQFAPMQELGLIREGLDRVAFYTDDPNEMFSHVKKNLAPELPTTRLHYYEHAKKRADLTIESRRDARPPSDITVSFFGSASSSHPDVLERTVEAANITARNGWNLLHGGGTRGVMGTLSEVGQRNKAFVYGISVDFSGAPLITFERDGEEGNLKQHDIYIASKDMIHRIETYALNSDAFVALDGGGGSLQEVLIIAELLSTKHPAVISLTATGEHIPKPLLVQNGGGTYTRALSWIENGPFAYLREYIEVTHSSEELEQHLQDHFAQHPPSSRKNQSQETLRKLYGEVPHPMAGQHTGGH
jgi:predicted Rossmann-fold nucleotide-binding protein